MKRSISLSQDHIHRGGDAEVDCGNMKKKLRENLVPVTENVTVDVKEETPLASMKRSISLSQDHIHSGGDAEVDCGKLKKKLREDLVPETETETVTVVVTEVVAVDVMEETPLGSMKRSISLSEHHIHSGGDAEVDCGKMKKKLREDLVPEAETVQEVVAEVVTDENLLYEVLKHVDARTLSAAGCVNKRWRQTAQDERLWELICTKQSANIGCGITQLRSVVLALGGFRRLYSHYLWPLTKPSASSATASSSSTVAVATATATATATASSSAWPCLPPPRAIVPSKPTATSAAKTRWGKDEYESSSGSDLI